MISSVDGSRGSSVEWEPSAGVVHVKSSVGESHLRRTRGKWRFGLCMSLCGLGASRLYMFSLTLEFVISAKGINGQGLPIALGQSNTHIEAAWPSI